MTEALERDIREIVADPEPDPEIRSEVLAAIEDAKQQPPRGSRLRLLIAPAAAAVLLLGLFLLTHSGDPEPEPTVCDFGYGEPIATVSSEDGRFHLDMIRVETAPAGGDLRHAQLSFQARLRRDDPDLFLAHGDPVSKVVSPDGTDHTPESHSLFSAGHFPGEFGAHSLDLGPAPDRLALLEISLVLMRLRPEPVEIVVPAGEPVSRILSPFDLMFSPEPESFSLSIVMTDRSLEGYEGKVHLGRSSYGSIRVTDAKGHELQWGGGAGHGGGEVLFFRRGYPDGGSIAYPVTVRMRDPRPLETIPAVFRFEDLALPPLAPGPRSDWGEVQAGLRMRVRRPESLEQGERMAVAVEIDYDPAGLPEGADRIETGEAPAFLGLRLARVGSDQVTLLLPDLIATPPPPPLAGGAGVWSPLDGTPVPVLTAEFPLARLRDDLPPGLYKARVEYTFPGGEERWPYAKEDLDLPGFWRGTVWSATFPLEIRAETPHPTVLVLPKNLEVVAGEQGPIVRCPEENDQLEEVRPIVPNGWYLGMRIHRDGEIAGIFWLERGTVLDDLVDEAGPLDRTYEIEVFRTLEPPGHFWGMGETETVLTRKFRVRATAGEIKALRKGD